MNGIKGSVEIDTRPPSDAEAWFARRLAHDKADEEGFEHWLREAPEHPVAWEKTQALWDRMGEWVQDGALEDYVQEALEPEPGSTNPALSDRAMRAPPRRIPASRRRLRYAAAAAAVVAAVAMLFGLRSHRHQVYATDIHVAEIRLPDGSQVRLDAGTRLEADMNWWHRSLRLLQGRAFFDVVHDERRPFVVDAGAGRITVLGTSFEVDRREDDLVVTLLRGSVSINSPDDAVQARLQPGEQARWQASTRRWSRYDVDTAAATRWTTGFHVFDAMPLGQAIVEINRYSQNKLRLADPSLAKLELSGNFHLGDAAGVANALPYVLPVKVREEGAAIVVSRR